VTPNRLSWRRQGFRYVSITPLLAGVLFAASVSMIAHAQNSRQNASPFALAQRAFEQLSEAQRKQIQDGLVWSGDYKGAVDGEFGPMTMRAIQAYEARGGDRRDGILAPRDISALSKEASRRKAAVEFRILSEPRAGVRIGVPAKFMQRRNNKEGAIFRAADRSLILRTFTVPESRQTLRDLFGVLTKPVRGRRIPYKVLRDGFLVVTAQSRARFSYTRVARVTGADGASILRGYTFSVSQSLRRERAHQIGILTIAISNSFDPSPAANGKSGTNVKTATNKPEREIQAKPVQNAEVMVATALAVAADTYVTIIPAGQCNSVRIGKAPARLLASDKASGLALFSAPVGGGVPGTYRFTPAPAPGPAYALFAELPFSGANPQISLARGSMEKGPGPLPRVRVITPASATGGVILTGNGDLAGFVARVSLAGKKVAGPMPRLSLSLISPSKISAFVTGAGLKASPFNARQAKGPAPKVNPDTAKSAAAVSSGYVQALSPVWCRK